MPGIKQEVAYDERRHWAPPMSIQWALANSSRSSNERWVFIRCCGQIGRLSQEGIVKSILSCRKMRKDQIDAIEVTNKHHNGRLRLGRTTRNQVKSRKPPLAVWSCCGEKIYNWQDHWSSRDSAIPFELVDSGCQDGRWDDNELELIDNEKYIPGQFARVAKKRS